MSSRTHGRSLTKNHRPGPKQASTQTWNAHGFPFAPKEKEEEGREETVEKNGGIPRCPLMELFPPPPFSAPTSETFLFLI